MKGNQKSVAALIVGIVAGVKPWIFSNCDAHDAEK